MKRIWSSVILALLLTVTACAPGTTIAPQQVATIVADTLTQTAFPVTVTPISGIDIVTPLDTPTPIPDVSTSLVGSINQKIYESPVMGFLFSYPENWYARKSTSSKNIFGITAEIPAVTVTSFNPDNPPHKLEWTDQTISMQFRSQPIGTRPVSLENWIEVHRQAALKYQLQIYSEERFLIANQPAIRLTLVSGSGGTIDQVLTILNNQEIEINIQGNYNLAKMVLDSIQTLSSSGLVPADADTPAAGICGSIQDDPASIVLGLDASGLPLAGRCIAMNPIQRIKFVNQSGNPLNFQFAGFEVNLTDGGETVLNQPIGEYLAIGVHFIPNGPELWVKDSSSIGIAPPPIKVYTNTEVGYKLGIPSDWTINESGEQVTFSPPYSNDPNVVYLSLSLDSRTLDQIINDYAQNKPDALKEDTIFNGQPAVKYNFTSGRNEYFIFYGDKVFWIATDQPNDGIVQSVLFTVRLMPPALVYIVTMSDNGGTFRMRVGDSFQLGLDPSYDWSSALNTASILDNSAGVCQALNPGVAILTALGNPKCLSSSPPCAIPSIMFSITVIVQ